MTAPNDNNDMNWGVYEDRLLAFFDILGFRKLIDTTLNDAKKSVDILQVLAGLDSAFERFRSGDLSLTLFSDTICISYRMPPNFASFCFGLSLVVTSLLSLGYLVRGSMVRGLLYHRGNVIFGPCLIRAYDLEQRVAIFPRIVIDPRLRTDFTDPLEVDLQPVYEDHDGMRCVNFLSPTLLHTMFRLLDIPAEPRIAEIVGNIDRLQLETSDDAAVQKVNWLRSYAHDTLSCPGPDSHLIDRLVSQVRQQAV
jgi:hypothetical protein